MFGTLCHDGFSVNIRFGLSLVDTGGGTGLFGLAFLSGPSRLAPARSHRPPLAPQPWACNARNWALCRSVAVCLPSTRGVTMPRQDGVGVGPLATLSTWVTYSCRMNNAGFEYGRMVPVATTSTAAAIVVVLICSPIRTILYPYGVHSMRVVPCLLAHRTA